MQLYKRIYKYFAILILLSNIRRPIEQLISTLIGLLIIYAVGLIIVKMITYVLNSASKGINKARVHTIKHITTDDEIINGYDRYRSRNNYSKKSKVVEVVEEDDEVDEEDEKIESDDKLGGYESSKSIATKTEKEFYSKLKEYCKERDYTINLKTRLEDLVQYADGMSFAETQKYRGQIKSRHVDYLIIDSDLNPVFAIELDDKSHDKKKAQQADKFKDDLFKKIGVPLYRVPADDFIWKLELEKIFVNY